MKAVKIFPDLYNIKPFINDEHPVLHPSTFAYEKYWSEEERKVIEGIWGLDRNDKGEGGWRYMTPSLYFYINYCVIEDEGDDHNPAITKNPDLRDTDWIIHYDYMAARQFSGWENAPFTCHRIVQKIQNETPLTAKEKNTLSKLKYIYDSEGNIKPYKDAVKALHETYETPLGLPLYENEALNDILGGSRGGGKEQPHYEVIMTPTGQTTMGEVKVGDYVLSGDGTPTKVIDKFPQGVKDVYRVHLEDGKYADCGLDHLWEVFVGEDKKVMSLKDILSAPNEYSIRNNTPIEYSTKTFEVDPYDIGITKDTIPEEYKFGDFNQRLALIQGVMDANTFVNKEGLLKFSNSSKSLIKDFIFICRSLGIQLKQETENTICLKVVSKNNRVSITNIEKLDIQYESSCILVDHPSHTYLTKDFIVTHNSFSFAGIITHEWVTHGVRRYTPDIKPSKVEILVGASEADKSKNLMLKVKANFDFLKEGPGAYIDEASDTLTPGWFDQEYKGRLEVPDSTVVATYKSKVGGKWVEKGVGSMLTHTIFTSEKPEKAASKRIILGVIEEGGFIGNLLDVMAAAKNSTIRRTKFGVIVVIGTSGNIEKVHGFKELMLKPDFHNILSFEDVYEGRKERIGRFLPAYYADSSFKDELGNTDIDACLEALLEERLRLSKGDSMEALEKEMMYRPIVPSEMFLSRSHNKLPVARLKQRLSVLEIEKPQNKIMSIGNLYYTNKERNQVEWRNEDLKPITTFNIDIHRGNLKSGIVIYEHPMDFIPNPTFKKSLYKVTYDPVKDDHFGTSLCSIMVHKGFPDSSWEGGFTDTIVAEWIGRLPMVNDMHEIAIKLAHYYNARILPETNIPDIVRYCQMIKKDDILQPTPTLAIGDFSSRSTKRYGVGVDMSNPRLQEHALQLLSQWLLTPNEITEGGETLKDNIDKIYSTRFLEEAIQSGNPGNYDHLRSAMILALWLSQESQEAIEFTETKNRIDEFVLYLNKRKTIVDESKHFYEY